MNDPREHGRSAPRHRRLCYTNRNDDVPYPMSRGRLVTRPFGEVDSGEPGALQNLDGFHYRCRGGLNLGGMR